MAEARADGAGPASLQGRQIAPKRPGITIHRVLEAEDGLRVVVRWDTLPGRPPAHTWLRCAEREPELVLELVRRWIYGEYDNPRITDVEPPPDEPCGGWLSPEGRFWRGSDITHPIVAGRIARSLGLATGEADPELWLEARGWQHVLDRGQFYGSTPTQAQRDTLFDLARRYPTMRGRIMDQLREEDGDG